MHEPSNQEPLGDEVRNVVPKDVLLIAETMTEPARTEIQGPTGRVGSVSSSPTPPPVAIVAETFLAQALVSSVFWMFMAPAVVALVTVFVLVFVLHDRTLARNQQMPPYGIGEFLRSQN